MNLAFFLLLIVTLFAGAFVFWVEPLAFLPILERLTPNILYRVRTELPLVGLSFDDGPHPAFTPQVLDILQRHGAKATFFLIGERALRHPDVLAWIKAQGHEVGNHYFRNGPTLAHSGATFLSNLEQTETALNLSDAAPSSLSNSSPQSCSQIKVFRPPGGLAWPGQIKLARQRGYTCVLGCAYPHDPLDPPVRYIRWLVEKNLVPGSIVILHDGISNPSRTLQALPYILEAAHKKGLRLVSIGELIRRASSPPL